MKNLGQKLKIKGWAILAALLVISASGVAQTVIKSDGNKERIVITKNNNTWKHTSKSGLSSFNIEYKGKIEVTDDDKDIKSISPGGYLEISKTTFGSKREILVEAASGGSLRREYYEGRTKTEWEPAGRKWLAEILPEIVRSTGIAAESRVDRFFKQGGVDAVINEIGRLDGNYVVAIYGKLLLAKDGLSNNDLKKAIEGISNELDSDYYLAEILKDNASRFLKNDATADVYFEAATKIGSDYYATVVLKEALDSYKPSASSLAKIMEASKSIGSDYYQASLLTRVLELDDLDGELLAEVIETTKDVSSDYYQSQILSKALDKKGLSSSSYNSLIVAVSDVSSDYYMASVFSKLAENKLDEDVIVKMIDLVDEKLSSDHYASVVLSKLMQNQDLSSRSVEKIANAITGLGSSHYASSAIKSISKNDNLSKESLISIIKAIGNISSDYYTASALESIAPLVKRSDESVKDAYRAAAKSINSDTYYGRAMRAID
ncbi:MAG: hypothetical protein ABJH05_02535 [Fulvivirga sp.]